MSDRDVAAAQCQITHSHDTRVPRRVRGVTGSRGGGAPVAVRCVDLCARGRATMMNNTMGNYLSVETLRPKVKIAGGLRGPI